MDQRGWNVIISTDFGLEVKYDWNMMLYITAPSSYFQTVGGLCGNYNGDRRDEFIDPKGQVLSSVIEFAKTWNFQIMICFAMMTVMDNAQVAL